MTCTIYSTYLVGSYLRRDLVLECETGLNNSRIFLGETHDILPNFPIP